ncbi:hypothetical protein ACFL7M_03990 [Thermodesulfobacteriota bacterium]
MNREGDVVLIHYQDQPAMYARIEVIEPDIKKDWYQVTLLLLTIPSQAITWILREEYINGATFTMGGNTVMLKKVKQASRLTTTEDKDQSSGLKGADKPGKVIPFKSDPG